MDHIFIFASYPISSPDKLITVSAPVDKLEESLIGAGLEDVDIISVQTAESCNVTIVTFVAVD